MMMSLKPRDQLTIFTQCVLNPVIHCCFLRVTLGRQLQLLWAIYRASPHGEIRRFSLKSWSDRLNRYPLFMSWAALNCRWLAAPAKGGSGVGVIWQYWSTVKMWLSKVGAVAFSPWLEASRSFLMDKASLSSQLWSFLLSRLSSLLR